MLSQRAALSARNPRTGRIDFETFSASAADVGETVARARVAQPAWQALGIEGRAEVLARWKSEIDAAASGLTQAVTQDTGRRRESLLEVEHVGKWIDRWSVAARRVLSTRPVQTSNPDIRSIAEYAPYPVVGVISPWNFPLSLSLMDSIPALLAGSAVVIKPSEVTPRFVAPLSDTIAAVPELARVLHYLQGAGDVGKALVEQVDMICFTGSSATGRKVAAQAAARFIPCFTELGGKDPAIVLDGSDLDRAVSAIATGATLATGQQCYSIERIYVARSLHDTFVEKLVAAVEKLALARPDPEDGMIGPLTFAPQADIIAAQLDDARAKGAVVLTGGEIAHYDGGLWCRPTVLTGVTHQMKVMTEESFGPLLPVMAFDTVDEAIALANDSHYGLSGAVFGPEETAIAVARRLNVGGISVNDAGAAPLFIGEHDVAEKTAFGASGLGGSRLGAESIKRFLRRKAILVNRSSGRSAWWFDV